MASRPAGHQHRAGGIVPGSGVSELEGRGGQGYLCVYSPPEKQLSKTRLANTINYDIEPVDDALEWFLGCSFLDHLQTGFENYMFAPDDKDLQRRVIGMLNGMDTGITGIRYKLDDEDGLEGVYLTHWKRARATLTGLVVDVAARIAM